MSFFKNQNRTYIWLATLIVTVILWRKAPQEILLWIGVPLFLGALSSEVSQPFQRGYGKVIEGILKFIGRIQSTLILGIIYFLILSPLALIRRFNPKAFQNFRLKNKAFFSEENNYPKEGFEKPY